MDAKTIDELNAYLEVWINAHYHKSPHHGLGGTTPEVAFKSDKKPLKFVDTQKLMAAFLHTEERLVDKTGCINFSGKKYEVGLNLIGRKVEVHYDTSWKDEIEVHYSGIKPFKAKELVISEYCGSTRELPEHLKTIKPQTSRLIEGLNKANITNRTQKEVAVVFRKIKEVAQDV